MTSHDKQSQLENQGWKIRVLPGFIETAGPLWTRKEGNNWAYGFLSGAHHLNPAGMVHGGMLLTLLDHAISTVGWEASGRTSCVTVQLDTHFVGAMREGQFAEARGEVSHRTRNLIFMRGSVLTEGDLVVSAQAILKVISPVP